jgi:hypothetical protein
VPHIRCQQVRVDDDRGRRDQVVESADPAVAFSVPTGELSGDARDILGRLGSALDAAGRRLLP